MKKIYQYLKERWKLENPWQIALALLTFSISGMSVLYVRKIAFQLLGFDAQTPLWEEAITWIIVVVPSYQVLFILYGTVLGQFDFVWRFQKRNLQRLKKFYNHLISFFMLESN